LKIDSSTSALEKQKTEPTQRSFSHFLTFNIQMNRNNFHSLFLKHSCLRGQKKVENDTGILQHSGVSVFPTSVAFIQMQGNWSSNEWDNWSRWTVTWTWVTVLVILF